MLKKSIKNCHKTDFKIGYGYRHQNYAKMISAGFVELLEPYKIGGLR